MKKIIAMLLALAMVAGWIAVPPVHAHAEGTTQNEGGQTVTETVTAPADSAGVSQTEVNWEEYLSFKLNEDGQSYCVSDCNTTINGALTIPATYNGLPVTTVGDDAFSDCENLTSVTIPDSVTSIDEGAFCDCDSLTDVYYTGTQAQWNAITIDGDNEPLLSANIVFLGEGPAEPEIEWTEYPETTYYYYTTEDGGAVISGLRENIQGYVALPATLGGYPVVRIAKEAFEFRSDLNGIIIPDTVTEIGVWAFATCTGLDTLILGSGLKTIGQCAFNSCTALTEVTIPASVTNIESAAFYGCTAIKAFRVAGENPAYSSDDVGVLFDKNKTTLIQAPCALSGGYTIPESVVVLANYAFDSCAELTEVTLPAGLTDMGEYVFLGCSSLAEVFIPGTVSELKTSAFANCTSLRNATIAYGVTAIGQYAFAGCEQLENINLPYSTTSIGKYAFSRCMMLTSITVPGSITSLGECIFEECLMLSEVKLKEGITTIGKSCFKNCYALAEVTIPVSVTQIGDYAFKNCDALITVFYADTQDQWNAINISETGNDALLNANLVQPDPCADGHVAEIIPGKEPTTTEPGLTEGWKCLNCGMILKEQEEIPPVSEPTTAPTTAPTVAPTEAPIDPTGAPIEPSQPEVDWENYLTFEMNEDGQSYCVSDCDTSISGALTIPATYDGLPVTTIGDSAFLDCDSLTAVTIPDSVTSIGDSAFWWCGSLTSVTIPNSVTSIGDSAFLDCDSLTSVTIGNSVTAIGNSAFYSCANLTDVYYTGTQAQWNAITIGVYNEPLLNANIVFLGGGSTEPTAPSDEPTAPTFEPVDPTGAPIEPSWPEAGWENGLYFEPNDDGQSYRVYDCIDDVVGELVIPSTYNGLPVTTIGDSAFSCCYELTGVVLPESITVIGSNAFANCHNLQSVNLPEGLVAIVEYAFASCDNLYEIQIPANVEYIGVGAFNACPLTGIWVDENNPNYANDEKGVLFSKNMTLLIAAPYGLTGSYAIPDGVEYIATEAFNNTRLSEVTFPDSVTEIGGSAFQNCYLTEIVIGNGVVHIGMDAFANCEYLTAVTVPNSVIVIADYAFQNSPNMTFYCHIGAYAATYADDFNIPICYIDAVKEVSIATMPEKLVYPLDGHLKLAGLSLNVTLEDDTVVTLYNGYTVESYDFSTAGVKTITVSVNDKSVSFEVTVDDQLIEYPESNHPYQNNSNITWKFTYPGETDMLEITFSEDTMVENGCDYIYVRDGEGNEIYYTGRELAGKKIVVPGKIFTIRLTSDGSQVNYGFAITSIEALNKVDLEKLTFTLNANGTGYIVTECDESAEGVLVIPAEHEGLPVEGIGENAFLNCTGLTSITIAEGITYIGNGAFGYCSGLKEITIPLSIAAIGDYAFAGCTNLTDVHYNGNKSQWNAIQMGEGEAMPNVKFHFSAVGCEHIPGKSVVVDEWGGGSCLETKYQRVVIYCADCGSTLEEKNVVLPPKGHTPGEPVIESEWGGGCTDYRQYQEVIRCAVCHEMISSKTITAEPVGHIEGETICYEDSASCTTNGYREWRTICTVCGYTMEYKTEDIPATGHTPGEPQIEREDPNCRHSGYVAATYYCVDCGVQLNRTYEFLPATDHIPGEVQREVETSVSCSNDGIYWDAVYCQDCGKSLSRERVVEKATGHTAYHTEIYNEQSASCESTGRYDEATYCQCGMQIAYKVVIIPPLGHTEEILYGYAPTCTSSGMTDGKYCTTCGLTLVWQQMINPLDHTPGDMVIENETETSYEAVVYCSACGVEMSREFVEAACAHGNTTTTTEEIPATCTMPGTIITTITCDDCGEILGGGADEIPIIEHTVASQVVENAIDSTCTENGYYEWVGYCACGKELFREQNITYANGHTPGDAVVEKETATSYDSVVYCVICKEELSRETIETACTHTNTITTTKTVPATCTTAGSVKTIVTCECSEVISETVEEIPATGIHTYDNDNDAVCNNCGFIRQMVDTYKFENYRVVFSDSNTTHKNVRVELYKLGNKTVADPSDDKALKAIDSKPATYWGAAAINNILVTDAGNYVLLLKYNVGTATVRIPIVLSVSSNPKLIIDKNNKLTVIDNNGANINHRVVVYYLGDKTVDDIYSEAALKAIDKAPQTIWQKKPINKLALTKGGNYVLHLCYNVGTGAKQTVAQMFTVESIPTLAVNQNNMLVATEENAENKNHRVTIFYLGNKTVSDPFNETEVKNAAISTKTVWGLAEINKVEIMEGGNYVFHMYYNVGTSAKRTMALEATLAERPKLSVSEDNKLVVEYSDASIGSPRAYIYNVGDKQVDDIYDEAALKKIATPTQVWGLSSILRKELTPGTYVIHFYYNVNSGAKSTVALKITIEP